MTPIAIRARNASSARKRAHHVDVAVGEIDHADDAVDHRVADRDQPVDRAERDAVDELLDEIFHAPDLPPVSAAARPPNPPRLRPFALLAGARTPDNAALRRYEPEPAAVQRVIPAHGRKPVMKILGKVLGVALASLIALPGAQARPRFGPGLVLAAAGHRRRHRRRRHRQPQGEGAPLLPLSSQCPPRARRDPAGAPGGARAAPRPDARDCRRRSSPAPSRPAGPGRCSGRTPMTACSNTPSGCPATTASSGRAASAT